MNKKILFTTAFILSFQFLFGQSSINPKEELKVKLEWKLADADTIAYKTLMQNIKSENDGNSPFQKLIEDTEFAEKIQKQLDNTNLVTYLTNSKNFEDVIEIELIGHEKVKKEKSDEDELDFMSSMMQGTLLRGSIKKSGEIHSFWLKRAQLNLISMFFELPGKLISKGDTWKLKNLALIGNDQNFKCEEAEQTNQIELVDLIVNDTDTIAVLNYTIREYVKGEFSMNNPLGKFAGKNNDSDDLVNEITKTRAVIIDYSFNATAKFSTTKGKWIEFNGIISATSLGFMGNSSTTQSYALKEIE